MATITASTRYLAFAVASNGVEDLEVRGADTKVDALTAAQELRSKHAFIGVLVEIVDARTLVFLARWQCHGKTWTQTVSWPAEEP